MKKLISSFLVASSVFLAGCSATDNSVSEPAESSETSMSANSPHPVTVSIDGTEYTATLDDSQAAHSLMQQLPLTLSFRDFSAGFDEKISDLDQPLEYSQDENSTDPAALDIAYWSPDERLVFYYGDVSAYSGIHVLGQFDSESAQSAIENLSEDSTVNIRLADG